MFYRMFNELPLTDQPDRDVIEDDEACDKWYDQYLRDITHQAQSTKRGGYGSVPASWAVPEFGGG